MDQEWSMQQLEKHIASGARQLVVVGAILMALVLASDWMQQWFSWVAVVAVLLVLILFIVIKLMQVVRWQRRIHEIMRKK